MSSTWHNHVLSDLIALIESGGRPRGGVSESSGTIPSIGGENITQEGRMDYSTIKRIPESFCISMKKGLLKSNDILINKDGAQTGKVAIYSDDFPKAAINEHVFLLRAFDNQLLQSYLFNVLLWENTQKQIQRVISGSAQPGLNSKFMNAIEVSIPPIIEQFHIAEILDTMSRTITQTERLIEKFRAIRNGLLHDLLMRGIGKDGRVRNPEKHPQEFRDTELGLIPNEWKVERLDDVIRIIDCKHYTPRYVPDGIPVIRPRNVKPDGLDFTDIDYVTEAEYAILTDRHVPSIGDIVFSRNVSSGVPCYVRDSDRFAIGQDVVIMTETGVISLFIFYALLSNCVRKQIDRELSGSTFVRINLAAIRNLRIPVPSRREQERISKMLDTLDTRIMIEDRILRKLKNTKRGLMNDLLTGRIRVKVPEEESGEL